MTDPLSHLYGSKIINNLISVANVLTMKINSHIHYATYTKDLQNQSIGLTNM